jgi:peptide deformylase
MYAENGLGIAALQIGDPTRMFLVEPRLAGRAETDPPVAFINPEVVWTSDETQKSDEGCLSFPDVYIKVKRPMRCKVRALGIDGQLFELEGEGLLARCLLHENDHLTGKLLVDFVGPLKRQMIKKKLQRHKDAELEEVEA